MILNNGTLVEAESTGTIQNLRDILERILKTFYDSNSTPDYNKIRLSSEYYELRESVRSLQIFDFENLKDDKDRMAFWINLHNLLNLHGILHFQIKLTVWERPNFFTSTEYNIGGYRFSLYDMIHGILRGNRSRWRFFPPPFRGYDPRVRFMLSRLDPRVHFTLHSASRSCPRLHVYHPETIDEELNAAARRFINSNHFVYDRQTRILSCSKIFKWYGQDFGKTRSDRFAFVSRFVDDTEIRAILREDSAEITIKYMPYDWHLNSSD